MKVEDFAKRILLEDLRFVTGVPCSYIDGFISFLHSKKSTFKHIVASSEGESIGIAAGYYLATGKVPIIYLQNSGLGDTIDPLSSLMDKTVFSMPSMLFMTWRGEPGTNDQLHHRKIGSIMIGMLKTMDIPYELASTDTNKTAKAISRLKTKAIREQKPVCLIFRSGLFEPTKPAKITLKKSNLMSREETLENLLPVIGTQPIIATTGKTSREIFELREKYKQSHRNDFLAVGSMGLASSIGLGLAINTKKSVFIIDGDGSVLMKMGTLVTIGHYSPKNLVHIIIDNGAHESTGGQPTTSDSLQWKQLLVGSGYRSVSIVRNLKQIKNLKIKSNRGPLGIVIYTRTGARHDLGRPSKKPAENKKEFMKFLSSRI